jgi:hypothetical protein
MGIDTGLDLPDGQHTPVSTAATNKMLIAAKTKTLTRPE